LKFQNFLINEHVIRNATDTVNSRSSQHPYCKPISEHQPSPSRSRPWSQIEQAIPILEI
jgi:hypothetical protein